METTHIMYVNWYKTNLMLNLLISLLLVIIIPFCATVGIDAFKRGDVLFVVIEALLVGLNMFNLVRTVKSMIRERKDYKEENRLYEEARVEMLKFCEIEEAFGEELELDFEEDDE
jgi:large-conductance mechanosensitive channel